MAPQRPASPWPVASVAAERVAASTPGAPAPIVAEYVATWDAAAGELRVDAQLGADAGAQLGVERRAERFVMDAEASSDGTTWTPIVRHGRRFEALPCERGACRVRYRYALRDAAKRIDDVDTVTAESEIVEAPPSTWLLAPLKPELSASRVRFRVRTVDGVSFVTGIFRSKDVPDAWDTTIDDLWTSPYSAFGALRVRSLAVQGGALQLAISPGQATISEEQLATWTTKAATAVSGYYGRFPMPDALVLVAIARGRWVGSGRTLAGGGGTVFMRVGENAPLRAYDDDWVLVHEMIHLSFPSVSRDQAWAEEGVATYVEPFARVRAGMLAEDEAWGGLADGLPNGLPRAGDTGLDSTHTWGRTYWGGALFWFLADVAIHERTNNQKGLEHALRGILEAGGNNAVRWPIARVMAVGDAATGVPVLTELYEAMRASPHPVEIGSVMKSLGVAVRGGHARFDDHAPLAAIRRAITHGVTQSP